MFMRFYLVSIPAKTTGLLSVQAYVPWGLPWGTLIEDPTYVAQTKKFTNVYLPGLGWTDKDLPEKADLAREFGARYTLTYKDTVLDFQHHPFQTRDALEEAYNAYLRIPTGKNGLTWDWGKAHYDVAISHSAGTRTLISLIQEQRITVDTVVLVSPQLISQQELENIINGHVAGVKRIIVYQSDADYCFHISQRRVLVDGIESWETYIQNVDTGWTLTLESPLSPVFYDAYGEPVEDSLYVGRDRETGNFLHSVGALEAPNLWNGVPHGDMDNHLKELLVLGQLDWAQPPVPDNVSEFASTVAVARDPSVKYGPEGNILPGQKLNYRVEYENEGEGIAYGVYFTDTLSKDLDDSNLEIGPIIDVNTGSEIAPPGKYNPATRTITWFAGEVGPGRGGYSAFSVNVRDDAAEGTEIINFATIYFPSVPEETRTNGIVSIVSLNQPPDADAGPDQTVEGESYEGTEVTLDGSGSTDPDSTPGTNDDIVSFDWYEGDILLGSGEILNYTFPLGSHTITLVVTDSFGETDHDDATIVVQDTTPPDFMLSVTPNVLWPPNHKMVQIIPTWTVNDNCDESPHVSLVKIIMNEGDATNSYDPTYDDSLGDGRTTNDIQVGSDGSIYLRAERAGSGPGRLYTITYKAVDDSGNVTTRSAMVTVPHDQR
jgi:hypothetical protein